MRCWPAGRRLSRGSGRATGLLRARQKVDKYRILGRISSGPLTDVYRAFDTIQKTRVALKIPRPTDGSGEREFLHEVQVATRLKHPNILSVLNASYIGEHFVIAMELGDESLADRVERRISTARAMDLAGQALAALAHAHEHRIIHCDIKPENFILFPGNQLKLGDFGFAKLSLRTLKASGSGTIDYIAPEQAMGRPKFQSDVFSMGLVLYRLFSGTLPEWPFEWPLAGHDKLMARVRPEFADLLQKAIQLDPALRYRDATQMQATFERLRGCSGASFSANTAKCCARHISAGAAKARSARACRPVRGAASTIRPGARSRRCHRPVRAANGA